MKERITVLILFVMLIIGIIISFSMKTTQKQVEINNQIDKATKVNEIREIIHNDEEIKEEAKKETDCDKPIDNVKNLGEFKITVYTPESDGGIWGYKTATGVKSKHLTTCAVDKSVIPLGTTIKVNGLELVAVDTGSAVKGNIIDIFYDGTEAEAGEWLSEFGEIGKVEVIEYE